MRTGSPVVPRGQGQALGRDLGNFCVSRLERLYVANSEWAAQALECQRSDFPKIRDRCDRRCDPRSNQDLAILGGLTQARGGVDDGADGAVIEAPLKADLP